MDIGHWLVWRLMVAATVPFVGCPTNCTNPDAPAISNIKRIQIAEEEFVKRHGRYGTLRELLPINGGVLPGELVDGQSGGHKFILEVNGSAYSVLTVPVEWGRSGSRSFYSDQTNVIRKSDAPTVASAGSKELK